jgi:hypothetical protein
LIRKFFSGRWMKARFSSKTAALFFKNLLVRRLLLFGA